MWRTPSQGRSRSGRTLAAGAASNEVAIIGGAEIFRAALPLTQRIYLTLVRGRPEGDIVLEPFDPAVWREASREPMQQTADDQFPADFSYWIVSLNGRWD